MHEFEGTTASPTLTLDEEPPDVPLEVPIGLLDLTSRACPTDSVGVSFGQTSFAPLVSPPRRASGNPQTRAFRKSYYRDVTEKEWNDWRWQTRNRGVFVDQ